MTLVLIILSCSKSKVPFELRDEQLINLVENLESIKSSEGNYHVFYSESFGSNIGVIKIYKSKIGFIEELDNKNQLNYHGGQVYVYSRFPTVKDSDKLRGVKLPYFTPDGTSWKLLIRSNGEDLIYESLSSVEFDYRDMQVDDDKSIF